MVQLNLWGQEVKPSSEKQEITYKAKSYKGLYALHKYWGKKPYNVIADLIKEHSNPQEIVLDPFLGSGVSITEALFQDRKALGIDLNPAAVFITQQLIQQIDTEIFSQEFLAIEKDLKDTINAFYQVKVDDKAYIGQNYLWENGSLSEIRYSHKSPKRISIEPTEYDYELLEQFSYENIKEFYPTQNFFHNSRVNTKAHEKIYELFTARNLTALSLLFDRIQKIENKEIKELFNFCFTSAIGQASKMVFVIKRRNKTKTDKKTSEKKEVGSWIIGYWKPKEFFENNVWTVFNTRFKKVLKAKKNQQELFAEYQKAENFEDLQTTKDYLLINKASQEYLRQIPTNSIDYIITDPPHGNRIPYLELSMLWNTWLQKEVNYEAEIVVSEAKERNKGIDEYNKLLKDVLEECFRVLKPEKKLSFMFNSLDDKAWIHMLNAFYAVGFSLEKIETLGYSANSVVQDNRKNALQTDFVLTYRKALESSNEITELTLINLEENQNIVQTIQDLKDKNYKPYEIMNFVVKDCLQEAKFVSITELIKEIKNEPKI